MTVYGADIDTASITAKASVIANIEEIAQHAADHHPDDIQHPRTHALSMFVTEYVNQYSEDFQQKGDNRLVYIRGDTSE